MSRPSQGLTEVLFVRVRKDLIAKLDAEVRRKRRDEPGRVVSRADVDRTILREGLR